MPDDTLFWILEEDFRFWPAGEDPDNADNYDDAVAALIAKREELGGGASSSLPPNQETPWSSVPERMASQFHTVHRQGNSNETEEEQGFFQDVADVMRIATMCNRHNMGEFIWLSWVPQKTKPSRIGHGSQCILMTKLGMHSVAEAYRERGLMKRGHIDLVLKDWLLTADEAAKARACYIYPPIGSYTEHPSECDPAQFGEGKTRPSGFGTWERPCHGTRLPGDATRREKFIIQWRPGWKDRPWIPFESEAVLHSERFLWKSFEDANAGYSLQQWKRWLRNPGHTQREKRNFREWMTMMEKRNWTTTAREAKFLYGVGKLLTEYIT